MTRILCYILACACLSVRNTNALPELSFPVNSQVPPVAYTSQPFRFTFSADTFRSDSEISFALVNEPSWLSLDSPTRTFFGTPAAQDLGDVTFILTASDKDGESSSSVTLATRTQQQVSLEEQDVLLQLAGAGHISDSTTLHLHQGEEFAFTVPSTAFSGSSDRTSYYAVSADNSPLPSWLHFSSESLSLSGSTPASLSTIPTQESYNVSVIASDIVGFAEAKLAFHIVVATHILSFSTPIRSLVFYSGEQIAISSLLNQLFRDDKTLQRGDLLSVTSDFPDWLRLNDLDLTVQGTAPADAQNVSFSVKVVDLEGNKASITLSFHVLDEDISSVPKVDLGIVNATAGTFFSYYIGSSKFITDLVNVTAELEATSAWLSFYTANMSLQGIVPQSPPHESTNLSFIFRRADALLQVAVLQLNYILPVNPTEKPIPSTSASTIPSTSSITPASQSSHVTTKQIIVLVLGIVLPVLAVILLVLLILVALRKRRKRISNVQQIHNREPLVTESSLQTTDVANIDPSLPSSVYRIQHPDRDAEANIELSWAPDSIGRAKHRITRQKRQSTERVLYHPSQNLLEEPKVQAQINNSKAALNPGAKLSGHEKTSPTINTLAHNDRNRQVLRSVANSQRFSLTQHRPDTPNNYGVEILSTPGLEDTESNNYIGRSPTRRSRQSSWQTTFDSTCTTSDQSSLVVLDSFPLPPQNSENDLSTEVSLRDVEATFAPDRPESSNSSVSFEVRRQRFHTQRARDRLEGVARFSNAGASRHASLMRRTISIRRPSSAALPANEGRPDDTHDSWSGWSGVVDHGDHHHNRFAVNSTARSQKHGIGELGPRLVSTVSSKLPFKYDDHHENIENIEVGTTVSQRSGLVTQRQYGSVEGLESKGSEGSHHGSFRFI